MVDQVFYSNRIILVKYIIPLLPNLKYGILMKVTKLWQKFTIKAHL